MLLLRRLIHIYKQQEPAKVCSSTSMHSAVTKNAIPGWDVQMRCDKLAALQLHSHQAAALFHAPTVSLAFFAILLWENHKNKLLLFTPN